MFLIDESEKRALGEKFKGSDWKIKSEREIKNQLGDESEPQKIKSRRDREGPWSFLIECLIEVDFGNLIFRELVTKVKKLPYLD